MKRVRILRGKVGLVFRNGNYQKVIKEGVHWLGFNQQVVVYDESSQFHPTIATEILLHDEKLVDMLEVLEVKDTELVLVYENENFKTVLQSGRYMYWKGLIKRVFTRVDISKIEITETINKALLSNYEIAKYIRTFEVFSYEKAILLVDDVYRQILTGGTYRFWKNNTSVKIAKVDTRQLQLEITGQELLTKDKANIRVNFYTNYKVKSIEKALLYTKDYEKQLYVAMQLALREYIGTYTLDELLENKEDIAKAVLIATKVVAEKLGVVIVSCGIRDVILPGDMKEIMNQVLVAQKKAQANIITRREETASTRSLLNTAKLMQDNEMLYKLKEMEYVEKIADKIGEITVSGNGNMVKQLKELFAATK